MALHRFTDDPAGHALLGLCACEATYSAGVRPDGTHGVTVEHFKLPPDLRLQAWLDAPDEDDEPPLILEEMP